MSIVYVAHCFLSLMGERWIVIGDESYMRPYLGSETMSISGGDYPFPDAPNISRVQFELGLDSLWCKRDEL
jgi:hypothetical protein